MCGNKLDLFIALIQSNVSRNFRILDVRYFGDKIFVNEN